MKVKLYTKLIVFCTQQFVFVYHAMNRQQHRDYSLRLSLVEIIEIGRQGDALEKRYKQGFWEGPICCQDPRTKHARPANSSQSIIEASITQSLT